eukprot:TRINITY_DN7267_c0_g1_i3.p1 TRINITY_DN7267_c0_g1~~TRINITY_DN7267_c0_g1_i3.p1  ORF type:complete len:516 (+),score=85.12 TRINITY_DN7267_c0_g1_i3:64-1611(+)
MLPSFAHVCLNHGRSGRSRVCRSAAARRRGPASATASAALQWLRALAPAPARAKATLVGESRPMGWLERHCHKVPTCSATLSSVIEGGAMDASLFLKAVRATARRHPMLRSVICKETQGFRELLAFEPDCGHCQVIEMENDDDWKGIVQELNNTPYDMYGTSPLWRFRLLKSGTTNVLVVSLHHAISDGSSYYILTNDILRFYNRLLENGDVGDVDPLPRLPSPDSMLFKEGNVPVEEQPAMQRLLADLKQRHLNFKPLLPLDLTAGSRHNTTLYRDGCEDSARALHHRCREKGLSVGAAQTACALFTLAKLDSDFRARSTSDISSPKKYNLDMCVNMRTRMPESLGNDHVGAIMSVLNISESLSGDIKFWDLVAEVKRTMNESISAKEHFYFLEASKQLEGMCDATPGYQEVLQRNNGHVQEMNFSNFTRYFYDPNYGRLKLTKAYVSGGGCSPTFASCVLWTATVSANHYSFLYATSDENTKVAQEFFANVVNLIEKCHSLDEGYSLSDWMNE